MRAVLVLFSVALRTRHPPEIPNFTIAVKQVSSYHVDTESAGFVTAAVEQGVMGHERA